jgi:N-acetylglucosaminyldiphosphoundecaprenol N-acetyl-beta-D-mannosaminyltransferase
MSTEKEFQKPRDGFVFAGIKVDNISLADAINEIKDILKNGMKGYILTPNAYHIVKVQKDIEFKRIYKNALLVLPDGMSIIFASKILGYRLKGRCAGVDLFPEICKIAALLNKNIFILGGTNGSEKLAEKKLKNLYPSMNIISYSPINGFENNKKETLKIIKLINHSNSNILIICVGSPKSEKWFFRNANWLKIDLAFSLGHALEIFAGTKKRAPQWIQNAGLEWLYRFIHEPKRLWKRYLIGNFIFIWLFLKEFVKRKF